MVVKIYVACHKPSYVPEHPLLVPIQVGAALSEKRFEGMVYDDTGLNISMLNKSYCELTAQYWAWKNDDADYFGFFHYRRYLSFRIKDHMRPYILAYRPDEELLSRHCYDKTHMLDLISKYDLIAPIAEEMDVSMRDYYGKSAYHHIEDLELVGNILKEFYPDFSASYDKYINGTIMYPCNIYIMKRELFNDYCAWLFTILNEYDCRRGQAGYIGEEARVNGYLAERLFGVYYTWLKDNTKVKSLELQRIDFMLDRTKYLKRRIKYFIVPPNSRRTTFARLIREKLRNR